MILKILMRKSFVKYTFILLLSALSLAVHTGCYNYSDIDDLLIVTGFGVDKGNNGFKYHITAEIVNVSAGGKEAGIETAIVEGDGNALGDAFRNVIKTSSKKLYFGHCRSIIIGDKLAKGGIKSLLSSLIRDHELKTTLEVFIAKGRTANEIVTQDPMAQKITMYEVVDLITNNDYYLGQGHSMKVYELVNSLGSESAAPAIPALDIEETKEYTTFRLSGLAIFNKDKMVGYLDEEQAKTYSFAVNKNKGGILTTKMNVEKNEFVSMEIMYNKSMIDYQKKDNKPLINIKLKPTVNIREMQNNKVDYINDPGRMKLKRQTEANLEYEVKSLITKVQQEFGTDIFSFGDIIYDNDPNYWKKVGKDWDKIFPTLEVNVEADVTIRGSGLSKHVNLKDTEAPD